MLLPQEPTPFDISSTWALALVKIFLQQKTQWQRHAVGLLSRVSPCSCSFLSSLRRIQSDINSYDSIMMAMFGT